MLVKIDENLIVDSAAILKVELLGKTSSQFVLRCGPEATDIVHARSSKSVAEVYDILNTISKE